MNRATLDESAVLALIREKQPISIYKLAKLLRVSYSAVWNMVERLELKKRINTILKPKGFVRIITIRGEEKNEI